MGKYDDIINLPHHVSDYHKPMPLSNRAAQFAPFAALSGHNEAIEETARQTENFRELSDEERIRLSGKLNYALDHKSKVRITFFIPDKTKSGGSYKSIIGKIKKWDEYDKTVHMEEGHNIPINFISEISILTY